MATSNIKLFDENKGNIMPDETYNSNAQRLNGVQSGIASSQLQNKFQYQVSLVTYALGQIMIANGYDALDSAAVSAFVNNMSSSLLQKVVDKANQTQAQSGTDDTKYMTSAKVKLLIDYILSHNVTISGNVNFTGTVSGQSPVADNNFTTKKYVDDSIGELGYELIWSGNISNAGQESTVTIPTGVKVWPYSSYMIQVTFPIGLTFNLYDGSVNQIILCVGKNKYKLIQFKTIYDKDLTLNKEIKVRKFFNDIVFKKNVLSSEYVSGYMFNFLGLNDSFENIDNILIDENGKTTSSYILIHFFSDYFSNKFTIKGTINVELYGKPIS